MKREKLSCKLNQNWLCLLLVFYRYITTWVSVGLLVITELQVSQDLQNVVLGLESRPVKLKPVVPLWFFSRRWTLKISKYKVYSLLDTGLWEISNIQVAWGNSDCLEGCLLDRQTDCTQPRWLKAPEFHSKSLLEQSGCYNSLFHSVEWCEVEFWPN